MRWLFFPKLLSNGDYSLCYVFCKCLCVINKPSQPCAPRNHGDDNPLQSGSVQPYHILVQVRPTQLPQLETIEFKNLRMLFRRNTLVIYTECSFNGAALFSWQRRFNQKRRAIFIIDVALLMPNTEKCAVPCTLLGLFTILFKGLISSLPSLVLFFPPGLTMPAE